MSLVRGPGAEALDLAVVFLLGDATFLGGA
jgi:hypothetical protein